MWRRRKAADRRDRQFSSDCLKKQTWNAPCFWKLTSKTHLGHRFFFFLFRKYNFSTHLPAPFLPSTQLELLQDESCWGLGNPVLVGDCVHPWKRSGRGAALTQVTELSWGGGSSLTAVVLNCISCEDSPWAGLTWVVTLKFWGGSFIFLWKPQTFVLVSVWECSCAEVVSSPCVCGRRWLMTWMPS